jgi:hypothetical protein
LPAVNSAQSYTGDNYSDIFEAFWTGMNNNYVFWDVDPTNWDQAYTTYKPLFASLKTFDSLDNKKAEQYFTQMTSTLIDSHYNLTFELTGNNVMPSLNRKLAIDKQYPDSIYALPSDYFTGLVAQNYIDASSLKMGTDSIYIQGAATTFTAITGTIGNSILYFYFDSFTFSQAGANTTPVLNSFFSKLSSLPSNIKGIVIDVRDNGGGEVSDLNYLVGKMITSPLTIGYTHSKSGIGRLDYTPWAPAIVTPQSGAASIQKPIVVLADHLSVSMAELTTIAIKSMPNGKFIGTTTWGANGPLLPSTYLNGGQFTIGSSSFGNNGYMFVYTSSVSFKALDGKVYEGRGISPDIWVAETGSAYRQGIDLQLAKAISYINSK